ncbi:hypothetical protein MSWH1_1211 [Methanosarcina sp. WH1]|nr:hypothetical protein MSWH1_1211 [Methanosarcina sp. WH1]
MIIKANTKITGRTFGLWGILLHLNRPVIGPIPAISEYYHRFPYPVHPIHLTICKLEAFLFIPQENTNKPSEFSLSPQIGSQLFHIGIQPERVYRSRPGKGVFTLNKTVLYFESLQNAKKSSHRRLFTQRTVPPLPLATSHTKRYAPGPVHGPHVLLRASSIFETFST